jgi:hypothetical protein
MTLALVPEPAQAPVRFRIRWRGGVCRDVRVFRLYAEVVRLGGDWKGYRHLLAALAGHAIAERQLEQR